MIVFGIFGDIVEFSLQGSVELNYLVVEDFIKQYGEVALYGEDCNFVECEEGKMYTF
jgi:hypothetical protein